MAGEETVSGRDFLRLLGVAAAIGIPAALIAALFLALARELQEALFDDLPDALGRSSPPWYLVVGLPVAGGVVVAGARRFLPGDGGHAPLDGLNADPVPVAWAPGVAVAALGTLGFGLVLGPEAPVMALGSAVGVAGARWAGLDARGTRVVALAGAASAISALFGGPLVAGILLLEATVGLGAAAIPALAPALVAAAVGYVLFVSARDIDPLTAPGLAVPDLPDYAGTRMIDLALAAAVGVLTAVLHERLGTTALLLAGGLVVGLVALAASGLGAEPTDVLFSGQSSVPAVVAEDSVGVVLVLLVGKLVGYAVSLGAGFRGGPIFPAVFLGVALASVAVVVFDSSPTWAVAVGAAAGMATEARLLVAAVLFGALLVGTAGVDTAPAAAIAAVAAWVASEALDRRAAAASPEGAPEA